MTRTFWLLANNVAAFPVKIYRQDEAAALAKHAGLQPEPMQVPDLFKNAEPKHG
ncbi:MAG: plasmid fertility inhibition factor family protein [Nitrosospira sp.]